MRGQGGLRDKGSEWYVILGLRVLTTSVEARDEGSEGARARRSKGYVILGFSVPTTSVGARGEGEG